MELQKFSKYSRLKDFLIRNGFAEEILKDILSLIEKKDWAFNNFVVDGLFTDVDSIKELAIQHKFVELWNDIVETNIDVKMTHLSNYILLPYFSIVMIVKELKERKEEK
jgi:hypothetical protein